MIVETAAAAAIGVAVFSLFIEPRRFQVHKQTIELAGPELRPLDVLHLSDLHFYRGRTARKHFLNRLADQPMDLIFITGDLIDDDSGIDLCLEALRAFHSRYGIYCVLGNHDYVHITVRDLFHRTGAPPRARGRRPNNIERLKNELEDMGIQVLQNERREIIIDDIPVTIAGVDDPYLYRDDIPKTFSNYEKKGPCFVLIHTPDRYQELSELGADMVFSGHTHGGQVCAPFLGPIITRTTAPRKFVSGLVRMNGTLFHTTKGVGSGRLTRPRFLCPPEVTFFKIKFTPTHPV